MNKKPKKKSQVISMDFIMSFVVYIFALSAFFFAMKSSITTNSIDLDISSDILFSRIDQTYYEPYDFMEGSKIDKEKLDAFLDPSGPYSPESLYDFVFSDFDNTAFSRIDYCIYLENRTSDKKVIIRNFMAFSRWHTITGYDIFIRENTLCGVNKDFPYVNETPECRGKNKEAVVISKPVLYGRDIVDMKVLACAKRK